MVRRPSTPALCLFFRQLAKVNHPPGRFMALPAGGSSQAQAAATAQALPCLAESPWRRFGAVVQLHPVPPFHRLLNPRRRHAAPPGNGSPHQFFGLLAAAPAAYLAADQLDQLHTRIPASAAAGARCGETQVSKAQPRAPQNVGCAQAPAPNARHPGPHGRADPSIACGISWRTPKSCCGGSRRKGI